MAQTNHTFDECLCSQPMRAAMEKGLVLFLFKLTSGIKIFLYGEITCMKVPDDAITRFIGSQ